ncbi:hypothetical protein ANFP_32790 (plasmid) [Acidithiobacillus ferrooxidans]|nr:hypothetical protein ANFP_32790 [Acidithiobacillus ferrooxidans]
MGFLYHIFHSESQMAEIFWIGCTGAEAAQAYGGALSHPFAPPQGCRSLYGEPDFDIPWEHRIPVSGRLGAEYLPAGHALPPTAP